MSPVWRADRGPANAQPRIEAVLMDLPAGLWERLDRLHAAAVLDQDISDLFLAGLFPGEPVRIACDLLVAGIETPTVIALACESPPETSPSRSRPERHPSTGTESNSAWRCADSPALSSKPPAPSPGHVSGQPRDDAQGIRRVPIFDVARARNAGGW